MTTEPCTRDLTVAALTALRLRRVRRSTLRALLPIGTTRAYGGTGLQMRVMRGSATSKNRVSIKFQDAIRALEKEGSLQRDGDDFILVRRPDLLPVVSEGLVHRLRLRSALREVPKGGPEFLALSRVLSQVDADALRAERVAP